MIDKAREIALKALYKIDVEEAYSNIILNDILKQNKAIINEKDIGLISEIVYGVTTWKLTIDEIIKKYSKIKLKKISEWIINILRIGIYQIIFLDKIPKSAAVNESVNLAKKYGHNSSASFVNAILRKIEKQDFLNFYYIKDDIERISKTTSMPEWIIKQLIKDNNNDIQEVDTICKNLNLKPKMNIRINKLKINKQDFLNILNDKKISYFNTVNEDFLILDKVKNVEKLDIFQKGYFTVQDISAGLTAKILNPKSNEVVLDACSAPGGKTTYIAELMQNKGKIEAWDIHEHRTKLVEQNAKRLGIDIIKAKVHDATIYNNEYYEKFDKILLDVPCLGIGVIKRKPDIKWKRKYEDIKEITNIQKQILQNCSKYLKKGGSIVYSTCSILKDENENIINQFLKDNKNFEILKYNEKLQMYNVKPDDEKDGFFICKLGKK